MKQSQTAFPITGVHPHQQQCVLLGRIARTICIRCGLLLQISCLCVCWSHCRIVQIRLNRSRCRLGEKRVTHVGPRNHVLHGIYSQPRGGYKSAMRPFAKLLWTLVTLRVNQAKRLEDKFIIDRNN